MSEALNLWAICEWDQVLMMKNPAELSFQEHSNLAPRYSNATDRNSAPTYAIWKETFDWSITTKAAAHLCSMGTIYIMTPIITSASGRNLLNPTHANGRRAAWTRCTRSHYEAFQQINLPSKTKKSRNKSLRNVMFTTKYPEWYLVPAGTPVTCTTNFTTG